MRCDAGAQSNGRKARAKDVDEGNVIGMTLLRRQNDAGVRCRPTQLAEGGKDSNLRYGRPYTHQRYAAQDALP